MQARFGHPELVVPLFTHGDPVAARTLLQGFPALRAGIQRHFEISAESANHSRTKMVAAMDRLEREITASGYLVGDSFTVADLTAAALFYPVIQPPEFPYPMVARDDLPDSWRRFFDPLAQRAGGRWVAEIYRRHRGRSAELTPAGAISTPRSNASPRRTTGNDEAVSMARPSIRGLAPSRDPASGSQLARSRSACTVGYVWGADNGQV